MSKLIICVVCAATLSLTCLTPLCGQQVGDAWRDYLIGGQGSQAPSIVSTTVVIPGPFDNVYSTQDPLAPVIWLESPAASVGWFVTGSNSVDIGPVPLNALGNGTATGSVFNLFFTTDPSGSFSLSFYAPAAMAGTTTHLAMAHMAPSSPDGFWISQTHQVSFLTLPPPPPDPNLPPSGSILCSGPTGTLPLGDESILQQNLVVPFTYYGTTYTSIFVDSNGYFSLGSALNDWSPTVAEFLSGPPRIAGWWDDLNPNLLGNVFWWTDNVGISRICYVGVLILNGSFSPNGIINFTISLLPSQITFDYEGGSNAFSGLVGCSPGNNLDPVGTAVNLSLGNSPLVPGSAFYEVFDNNNPLDLIGLHVTVDLDGSGNPIFQH